MVDEQRMNRIAIHSTGRNIEDESGARVVEYSAR